MTDRQLLGIPLLLDLAGALEPLPSSMKAFECWVLYIIPSIAVQDRKTYVSVALLRSELVFPEKLGSWPICGKSS